MPQPQPFGKFKHSTLIIFAGIVWLLIGIFLLTKGIRFLATSQDETSVFLICIALLVGTVKGRFVLSKAAKKMIDRIRTLEQPARLYQMYSAKFYLVIAFMIGLGLLIRFLDTPLEIRGAINTAIGSALINGSVYYFKSAFQKQSLPNK